MEKEDNLGQRRKNIHFSQSDPFSLLQTTRIDWKLTLYSWGEKNKTELLHVKIICKQKHGEEI